MQTLSSMSTYLTTSFPRYGLAFAPVHELSPEHEYALTEHVQLVDALVGRVVTFNSLGKPLDMENAFDSIESSVLPLEDAVPSQLNVIL